MFSLISEIPSNMPDAIPAYLTEQLHLLPKSKAIQQLHFQHLREQGIRSGKKNCPY